MSVGLRRVSFSPSGPRGRALHLGLEIRQTGGEIRSDTGECRWWLPPVHASMSFGRAGPTTDIPLSAARGHASKLCAVRNCGRFVGPKQVAGSGRIAIRDALQQLFRLMGADAAAWPSVVLFLALRGGLA